MINVIKTHWRKITVVSIIAYFSLISLTAYLRPETFAVKPTQTEQTVKELQAQLSSISGKLDSATVLLNKNDKALKETLTKLRAVEWQLALSTQIAQRNLDSLSAKFEREAAKEATDDELLKGLGL